MRHPRPIDRLLSKPVIASLVVIAALLGGLDVAQAGRRTHHSSSASARALRRSADRRAHTGARIADPFDTTAFRHDVDGLTGDVSVAVDDLVTGQTFVWNPNERAQTASIVKADILETLLYQAEQSHTPLSADTSSTVQGMIENSDNTDATDLWDQVGGAPGIAGYDKLVPMPDTVPAGGGFWGETMTSAADQIALLRVLVDRRGLLDAASQQYQLGLMENVESDQDWGVSGGVPSGVSIALKNGWVPLTSYTDWEVNSIGRIKGDGRWYLLAVLTAHDPSEQYGITSIDGISSIVWNALAPRS